MKFHRSSRANARLTPERVWEMRQDYATGQFSYGDLSRKYGIGSGQVGKIIRGEAWQEFDNPAASVTGPQPSAREPTDDEIRASEQRLAALMAQNLPKASVDSQLDQFINPRAKARYYGEQADEQSNQKGNSEGAEGALGAEKSPQPDQGQGLRGGSIGGTEQLAEHSTPDTDDDRERG